MACGGLYIDTLQPFGAFRRCLWFADRDLPYGEVAEVDEFSGILKDPQVTAIFENCILPQAAEYADDNREWAGWIVWTKEEGYSYLPLDFEASAASVFIRQRPVLPEDTHLVIDVHSHGTNESLLLFDGRRRRLGRGKAVGGAGQLFQERRATQLSL